MSFVVIIAFWTFCAWVVVRRRTMIAFMCVFLFLPFGMFATLPPAISGGLTLLPSWVMLAIGTGLLLANPTARSAIVRYAISPDGLAILTLFAVVVAVSAYVYPRIFAGTVEIIPVRNPRHPFAGSQPLLTPSMQNISQAGYLILAIAFVFILTFLLQIPLYRDKIVKSIFYTGIIIIVTGLLDSISNYVNIDFLLDPFRTASYVLNEEQRIMGFIDRLVGLMPEASVFGPLCIAFGTFIYLGRDLSALRNFGPTVCIALAALLFVMGIMSTSSSAYIACVGAAAAIVADQLLRRLTPNQTPRTRGFPWITSGLLAVALGLFTLPFLPDLYETAVDMMEVLIFDKSSSDSFAQRMGWNRMSLRALVDSHLIGVGVGSTRTSSWPVAVVSQVGVPGAIIFLIFLANVYLKPKLFVDHDEVQLSRIGQLGYLPVLAGGILTEATPNFGVIGAFCFAAQIAFWWSRSICRPERLRGPIERRAAVPGKPRIVPVSARSPRSRPTTSTVPDRSSAASAEGTPQPGPT